MNLKRIKNREAKHSINHAWILFVIGGLTLTIGLWTIFAPQAALISKYVIFITSFIVLGILHISYMITTRKDTFDWSWGGAIGTLSIIGGIILAEKEAHLWDVLLMYIGLWAFTQFFIMITTSFILRNRKFVNWIITLTISIIGLTLSIVLMINPTSMQTFNQYILGGVFMTYAIPHLYYAIAINKVNLHSSIKNESNSIR